MPPYEAPPWVVPEWWAPDPTRTAVSGNQLIERWFANMASPKPPVKVCIPELAGWSGLLGRRPWVQQEYRPRPAELARGGGFRRRELDEPDSWNEVSRLYADYVDPFARFTGRFAETADALRPAGLPNDGWLRPLKNRVPPMVRAVAAGPGQLGGAIESGSDAERFLRAVAADRTQYESVACRGYLSILLDRIEQLREADSPDESVREVLAVLEATIAAHAPVYGDPDQPLRKPTEAERERVRDLLAAKIAEQPSVESSPYFTEAYARATRTLLRWVVQGREQIDACVLFSALRWARLDEQREQARREAREVLTDPAVLPEPALGVADAADRRAEAAATLARARVALASYSEPGRAEGADSWEKTVALRLLDRGNALAFDAYDTLAQLVAALWHGAANGRRPAEAYTFDAATAARYIQSLLAISAAAGAIQPDDNTTRRFAQRFAAIVTEVEAHRAQCRTEETGT